jgi:hypothetical protein
MKVGAFGFHPDDFALKMLNDQIPKIDIVLAHL